MLKETNLEVTRNAELVGGRSSRNIVDGIVKATEACRSNGSIAACRYSTLRAELGGGREVVRLRCDDLGLQVGVSPKVAEAEEGGRLNKLDVRLEGAG